MQRNHESMNQQNKPVKDFTYYIKTLVQKNFEQMLNFSQKIPFAIRAMLKIILIRGRGLDNINTKIKPDSDEIKMLAEIMIAGWLNQGYRNPKCFGIQPSVERELEMEYIFFQAARMVFEHTMIMLRLPKGGIDGFDVTELNSFIEQMSSQVFIFWTRLVNIDLSELNEMPKTELIKSNMIRIDDLELLFVYSQKLFLDVKNGLKVVTDNKYTKFNTIMTKLD